MVPRIGTLIRGLIIGFSIAAPVGPIGLLCIRRTLADGRVAGFVSGLGAATADGFYGAVAAFGLTIISHALIEDRVWLRLVGGAFLCYLGVRTFLAKPAPQAAAGEGMQLAGAYISTFLLTLTNPLTILSFAAVFAGLGLGSAQRDYASAVVLVLGVFAGSALWWLTLSTGVGLLRTRVGPRLLVWVNRISGTIIAAFGVAALLSLR
ncbi:MAG: putative threonine efflux protein [Armatimonadetes bacterium CSP1-3]|nr:MAG: putative threonine efflux protein [Armatimonadetes bacterium CSP1-3]